MPRANTSSGTSALLSACRIASQRMIRSCYEGVAAGRALHTWRNAETLTSKRVPFLRYSSLACNQSSLPCPHQHSVDHDIRARALRGSCSRRVTVYAQAEARCSM
eukprot:6174505-Pleurochrysis_carterae.AAC.1